MTLNSVAVNLDTLGETTELRERHQGTESGPLVTDDQKQHTLPELRPFPASVARGEYKSGDPAQLFVSVVV